MSDQETQGSMFGSDDAGAVGALPPAAADAGKSKGKAAAKPKAAPKGANTTTVTGKDEDGFDVNAFGERMFTIIVEESAGIPPTGQFIGINGRSYMVRPGEEVTVPESVLEVLNDAVEGVPRTDQAGNVIDYRDRQRVPYRIVTKRSR